MYLLEGLARWNKDRASAVFDQTDAVGSTTYSSFIGRGVHQLSEDVLGKKIDPSFIKPREYTGNNGDNTNQRNLVISHLLMPDVQVLCQANELIMCAV